MLYSPLLDQNLNERTGNVYENKGRVQIVRGGTDIALALRSDRPQGHLRHPRVSDECACPSTPQLVNLEQVGGLVVAVVIETPFPSIQKVAKTLGVSKERVKEIERLIEARYSKAPEDGRVPSQRSGKGRRSARSRSGQR